MTKSQIRHARKAAQAARQNAKREGIEVFIALHGDLAIPVNLKASARTRRRAASRRRARARRLQNDQS